MRTIKIFGKIVGWTSKGISDSGKQEITIALDKEADAIPIGSKAHIVVET